MKIWPLKSYKRLMRYWLLASLLWLLTPAALAHPLDEFYQVTFITLAPDRISLIVELYPGILVAPQILAMIDLDQDDLISEEESQAYLDLFLQDITFEVDGTPLVLAATQSEFAAPLDIRGGIGVIRFNLQADLPADHRGGHQFFYRNNHRPDISVYIVSAVSGDPNWVQIGQKEPDVLQASLRLDYTINEAMPAVAGADQALDEIDLPGGVSAGQELIVDYLYDPDLSPFLIMVLLGLSIFLGGVHALTPGHGKTLVAAYLIGSRGTIRHAIFLGSIVTFTHTASVIGIGLLALLASQFIVPDILVPALEILAGLLVVYLGMQLLWSRWQAYHQGKDHHHSHVHAHPHEHEDHDHDASHHHHIPEQVKVSDLLTLGISGGLVPCPEALTTMIIAIGLNRILLGLSTVVAFSFGLAAVLIILGILLVRMRWLLDRVSQAGGRWQTLLPLLSAGIVTLLGLGILVKGLMPYLLR